MKSRFRTDWDGFIINNFDCDFVVFVTLSRGPNGVCPPEFYILPVAWVTGARDPINSWGKITKSRLAGIAAYKDGWDLISAFLRGQMEGADQQQLPEPSNTSKC